MTGARAPADNAVFYYSPIKTVVLSLFIMVLAVTPLVPVFNGTVPPGLAVLLVLTGGFFGGWLVAMAARLMWQGPVIVIDKDGILDQRIGPRPIPWARITQLYPFRARSQLYIAVIPDNPDEFAAPPGRLDRMSLWTSDAMRLPRYSISTMGLTGSTRAVMAAMARFMPDTLHFEDGPRR